MEHDGIDFIVLEVLPKNGVPGEISGFLMYQLHLHKEPTGIPIKI
jgi:hypothetical protein